MQKKRDRGNFNKSDRNNDNFIEGSVQEARKRKDEETE